MKLPAFAAISCFLSSCAGHGLVSRGAINPSPPPNRSPAVQADPMRSPPQVTPDPPPEPAPDHSLAVKYTGCVQASVVGQRDRVANYQITHYCTDRDDENAKRLAARQSVVDELVAWMASPGWPRIVASGSICVEEARNKEAKENLRRDKAFSRRFNAAPGSYIAGQEWVIQDSEDKISSIRSENKELAPFLSCTDPAVAAFSECHHTPNDHNHSTWYSVDVSRVGEPIDMNGPGRPASKLVDEDCISASLRSRDAQASRSAPEARP